MTVSERIQRMTGEEVNQLKDMKNAAWEKLFDAAKTSPIGRATLIMWSPKSKRIYTIFSLHSDFSWALGDDIFYKGNQPLGIVTLGTGQLTFDPLVADLPRGLTLGSLKKQLE